MNILEFFQLLTANIWIYGGSFIIILSLLVFIHEWGHYIVARMCGVRVETFSIGFGKEIFGKDDRHGTRWKVSMIPLGGYVKLFGDMDPASAKHSEEVEGEEGDIRPLTADEKKVAFFAKPVWQRALVVFAGPAINYIFAIIVLALLFATNGQPVTPPVVGAIVKGSSADQNEFQPHDRLISINGRPINAFEDIRREMMISLDEERRFIVERDGQDVEIMARPEKVEFEDRFGFKQSRGLLGIIGPRYAISVDDIQSIDGVAYDDSASIRNELAQRLGTSFDIVIQSGGEETDTYIIRPLQRMNPDLTNPDSENYNILHISEIEEDIFVKFSPVGAFGQALKESWEITAGTLKALSQIIVGSRSANELGGVIRIGALAGDMAQQGMVALILFTALLSINLGLINLLPIPLLDGGHLVFYAFEAVLGKPIPEQVQEYAFRFGLAFLVCIMVFANLNDLVQLIG